MGSYYTARVLLELTFQEQHECKAHPRIMELEEAGGWMLEIGILCYAFCALFVLIERYYIPALETLCKPEVLDIPPTIAGASIMAAGNCLPELSISLVAILTAGEDLSFGEVMGSCTFDLLAVIGTVSLFAVKPITLDMSLITFFFFWICVCLVIFGFVYMEAMHTWQISGVMVTLYVLFTLSLILMVRLLKGKSQPMAAKRVEAKDVEKAKPADPPTESTPMVAAPAASPANDGKMQMVKRIVFGPLESLFRNTVFDCSQDPSVFHLWPMTLLTCICYTLGLTYGMVMIAGRFICLLGIRKSAMGATVLCIAAGFPDLVSAVVVARNVDLGKMAVCNGFGAFIFNSLFSLGLPWFVLGFFSSVFPPHGAAVFTGWATCFVAIFVMVSLLASNCRLDKRTGMAFLFVYLIYNVVMMYDGVVRKARPPDL